MSWFMDKFLHISGTKRAGPPTSGGKIPVVTKIFNLTFFFKLNNFV